MGEMDPSVEPELGPEAMQEDAPSQGTANEGWPGEEGSAEIPAKSRKGTYAAVAALVVVIVVVLATLFVVGIGPFSRHPSSNSNSAPALTYSEAESQASSAANSAGGGPWSVLYADGVDFASSFLLNTSLPPASSLGLGSGCTTTHVSGQVGIVSLPSDQDGASTGSSPSWVFILESSHGLLFVSVVGGQAQIWGELSGAACDLGALLGTLPTVAVDSPVAVSAAMNAGGKTFISDHPGGNLSYSVSVTDAVWTVNYTNCPDFTNPVSTNSYFSFDAAVSLSTGKVIGNPSSGTGSCSNMGIFASMAPSVNQSLSIEPALDTALGLQNPASLDAGTNWVININTASQGVAIDDLTFEVMNPSGARVSDSLAELDLDSPNGCLIATGFLNLAYYSEPLFSNHGLEGKPECASTVAGANGTLIPGETILLQGTTKSIQGDTFEVLGTSHFNGSVNISLPNGPSLAAGLVVNASAYVDSSGHWVINVTSAPAGLTIGDLGFLLVDSAQANVSAGLAEVFLQAPSGCYYAQGTLNSTYYGAPSNGNECGLTNLGGQAVVAGDRFVLSTGLSGNGSGDTLEILGWFHFSGMVRVTGP